MEAKTKVGLVQINNSFSRQHYFPYSVGILQAYAQRHLARAQDFEFLPALFSRVPVREAVAQLEHADIVCFSTYVWNIRLSLAIAQALKQARPGILTVFGGPQIPDHDTESFLRAHPCIDLACHGEGERVLTAILDNAAGRTWTQVPSLSFLDGGGRFIQTPAGGRITDFSEVPSPYLEGVFDGLIRSHPEVQWVGLWETNRGCPFTCAYCDWGSATKNTVVARDMDQIDQEIDWFSRNQVEFIFCCDANFSLLDRDLDIVRHVAANKARHGYPKALSVQSTKNFTDRSYALYRTLSDAALSKGVSLSLQSVHPDTLEAIRRKNIPSTAFRDAQERLTSLGIETFTDLILGLPRETYDSFVEGVCQTIQNGQHNRIQFNNLSILPNALMGDPQYQGDHGMEIVETNIVNIHGSLADEEPVREKQRLVVGTASCPRPDWVKTRVFGWMTALLHFDKLLQVPIVLLNTVYGIPYRRMLEPFVTDSDLPPILERIRQFFMNKAQAIQNGDEEFCQSQPWLNLWWPADELVMIRLCTEDQIEAFYEEVTRRLEGLVQQEGPAARTLLEEAVFLNQSLIKLPFQTTDASIDLSHNLWDLYQGAIKGRRLSLLKGRFTYRIDRTSQTWLSWEDWCREVIWWGNKRGAYLYPCQRTGSQMPIVGTQGHGIGQQDRIPSRCGRDDGK
jgi:radical SAM superfamily enzyme YgiQ (UPF0313 family)